MRVTIQSISVAGFKSIGKEQTIELRPLTILAGANSSGKSSIIQPLLLMKQTLEAQFDPGALRLDGPNVQVTSADQILSRASGELEDGFRVGLRWSSESITFHFCNEPGAGFRTDQVVSTSHGRQFVISSTMDSPSIQKLVDANLVVADSAFVARSWRIETDRFFMDPVAQSGTRRLRVETIHTSMVRDFVRNLIHLSGLRAGPERIHNRAAVNGVFPGLFRDYVASVIDEWQEAGRSDKLESVGEQLSQLGLTWKVAARRVSDAGLEIMIGRLPRRRDVGGDDLIHIADAGLGVSQVLPVLVALQAATPGQTVYIEEPESHLHPRAQVKLAKFIGEAAKRGICVVAETHSFLFLRGIQTLIARGKIAPSMVKAHWFQRNPNTGVTRVSSADFDEHGAFGKWPEDFYDVALDAESRYMEAIEDSRVR